MKYLVSLLLSIVLVPCALANGPTGDPKGHPTGDPAKVTVENSVKVGVENSVKNENSIKNENRNQQEQRQTQEQSQGQSQSASSNSDSSANNAGNSQNISTTYKQVRQAPLAYAPDAIPSAPCRVSGSAGVSSPVGGVSLGGSKLDKECDKRETARAFALIGQYGAALQVLCSTKAAKVVKDCANLPVPISPVEELPVVPSKKDEVIQPKADNPPINMAQEVAPVKLPLIIIPDVATQVLPAVTVPVKAEVKQSTKPAVKAKRKTSPPTCKK